MWLVTLGFQRISNRVAEAHNLSTQTSVVLGVAAFAPPRSGKKADREGDNDAGDGHFTTGATIGSVTAGVGDVLGTTLTRFPLSSLMAAICDLRLAVHVA